MRKRKPGAASLRSVETNHWSKHKTVMKVVRKNSKGETKHLLLKEYFLNAYLIAVLKRVGEETARFTKGQPALEPVRVRSGS